MARAKRHYLPGHVWHITHRCHKKEFLLKFARDRRRWVAWLFEARKRYGLKILNYIVTSNHIHLLVDGRGRHVIPESIRLIAGRTAQEYNQRKKRNGAFWEDRYHATAVQQDDHLIKCLTYIDLNMVRAGIVKHPSEWEFSGYNEIQNPRQRYRIIDYEALKNLFGFSDLNHMKESHQKWIDEALKNDSLKRETHWTQSVAVGGKTFLQSVKEDLNHNVQGRSVASTESGSFQLREAQTSYGLKIFEYPNTFVWS
ncbi:REP element-mobilizing transposase RayT [Desulfocicer vacuolatum DSM 3385]|uniref:REP element-mobilizing transposase RayT n=1 Tax=Desulfocicer vacuolatum DSM 3385 TaxID=1121400 RepID=A0A1W2DIC8_9BACT|nr:transposase [Desulfocicer vacuolatum]SMC96748.1 REP element-mobilizing transposase RayT [Desulfocicer vacuolatum DSM 3385]